MTIVCRNSVRYGHVGVVGPWTGAIGLTGTFYDFIFILFRYIV